MIICKDEKLCTGCAACSALCAHSAISMAEDARGFYRPQVDASKCMSCGLCKAVCPSNHEGALGLRNKVNRVLAYQNSDEERSKSSSGAAFWALARSVFDEGGVVYGACFDEGFRVVHRRCATVDEAQACRGSKYSQSFTSGTFGEVLRDLRSGRAVLYSGTPCQIAGLRSFLLMRKCAGRLITCDLICHGTPSNRLFREYIAFLEEKTGKKVVGYCHRPKDRGWGVHIEKAVMEDGTALYDTVESNVWRTLFYSNDALNSCCYACQYAKVDRVGDFTLADFVGVDKVRKELNDDGGLSVVLVNSDIAARIVAEGVFGSRLVDVSLDEVLPGNPMLQRPSVAQHDVDDFWRAYDRGGLKGAARYVGAYGILRSAKTMVKRFVKRR